MFKRSSKDERLILKKRLQKCNLKEAFKSTKTSLFQCIKEFCKNSTLHGLSYLANKDLSFFEKIFFAISFITVVIIAAFFINEVYHKWCTTPVVLCINPQPTHIKNEPFPALTICNMNQAYKSKVKKFKTDSAAYATTQMLCKHDVNDIVARSINDWSFLNRFITNISQPCENMLLECHYGGIKYNCSQLFHPIVTDEGLCCSFNMVHPKFLYKNGTTKLVDEYTTNHEAVPWTAEAGYPSNLPKNFYPYKAAGIGELLGLDVILNVEADEYYCSSSNTIGFKMVLHSPTETPCVKEVGLLLAPGYETKARVRIEKLQSDPKLHRVHIKHRQCLFQDEDNLYYFASYSQHNCIMECVAKFLMRHCGCVSYFMPRDYGNETVCSIYDQACMERLELYLIRNGYDNYDNDTDDIFDVDANEQQCEETCLPSCSDLKYYAEFFATPLSSAGHESSNKILRALSSDYIKQNIAILTVYYKDSSYRTNIQTEFIGMTDVLSSVGGLIGLFFGFSFMSLAEIIFYTFIRPCRKSLNRMKDKSLTNFSASQMSIKSPSIFKNPYKSRRKTFKTPSFNKVSPKVMTISRSFENDGVLLDSNYMSYLTYNMNWRCD